MIWVRSWLFNLQEESVAPEQTGHCVDSMYVAETPGSVPPITLSPIALQPAC